MVKEGNSTSDSLQVQKRIRATRSERGEDRRGRKEIFIEVLVSSFRFKFCE